VERAPKTGYSFPGNKKEKEVGTPVLLKKKNGKPQEGKKNSAGAKRQSRGAGKREGKKAQHQSPT